ncbi:MAG TPA: DUF6282 family protein [Candidatus Binatia bacterium]|jgi:hypothetical protein|nr:DUF6282 family protein [Candidatus Binatia bacterium]
MSTNTVSTPTHERCVTSYAARTQYKPGTVHPPHIKVKDAIDIHCHAHEGQQDAFDLARRASLAEMKGLLFKSIPGEDPAKAVRDVQEDVNRWSDKEGVKPIMCWAGYVCGRQTAPVSAKTVSSMIDGGVRAIWLPVFNHAITLSTVGTYRRTIEGSNANGWHGPLPWDEAITLGHYNLNDNGELKTEVKEIVRICADRNVALFFGHATHKEIYKLAEEAGKVGLKRAVIDHPYSPFLNVSPQMMKELSPVGILFNFTWDELSPLLGVDPQIMYNTIREVGPEHFTLSSDAGEPLFPDSVEAMRLVRGYMEAFGLNKDELYTVCTRNPAKVVGLEFN